MSVGAATKASTSAWITAMMSAATPGLELHLRRAAVQRAKEKGCDQHANRVGLPQQRDGDAVETDAAAKLRREFVVEAQRLDRLRPARPAHRQSSWSG